MELIIISMLLVQSFYVVSSDTPNSKLKDSVKTLEEAILKENPCLNCMLEVRIKYLELFVKKFLTPREMVSMFILFIYLFYFYYYFSLSFFST